MSQAISLATAEATEAPRTLGTLRSDDRILVEQAIEHLRIAVLELKAIEDQSRPHGAAR